MINGLVECQLCGELVEADEQWQHLFSEHCRRQTLSSSRQCPCGECYLYGANDLRNHIGFITGEWMPVPVSAAVNHFFVHMVPD